MKLAIQLIPVFLPVTLAASPSARAATQPVRAFILAGQSNMEGAGQIKADPKRNGGKGSLEFLAETYDLIGEAMGEAMKRLLGAK
jgi:hypothetical protein